MWYIPLTAGLQDGINPYALMTCAMLLALHFWLGRKGLKPEKFLGVFIGSVFVFNLALNIGFCAQFVSGPVFHKTVIFAYFVLAAAFLSAGVGLFYGWVRNRA